MIIRDIIISSDGKIASLSEDIYIYVGDGDVSIQFTIKDTEYICIDNDIETNFEYCSFKIKKPIGNVILIPQAELVDGKAILTISKEMIDEDLEVGEHQFTIHLYDKLLNRLTLPNSFKFTVLEEEW